MKRILKELFFLLAPKRLPNDRAAILMYHSVSGWDHFTTVSPQTFERQMRYLAERKVPVVSLSELVRRLQMREPLGGSVAITFDDGYRDNLSVVLPILERHRFSATVFVTTDWIGSEEGGIACMSDGELKQIVVSGLISLEPHSKSHPYLSRLPEAEARSEMADSKKTLEGIIGEECRYFAYPFGDYSQETVALARDVGFKAACTVLEGTVHAESLLMELPRVSIDSSTTRRQFRGKLSRAVDWYEQLKLWR